MHACMHACMHAYIHTQEMFGPYIMVGRSSHYKYIDRNPKETND